MADHSTIPIAITYQKPGTEPPLFVAGSFSAWEPQEMDCTTDEDGKHVFVKTVRVPPGTQIQYKFRVGQGDWWVLNDEAPTATDDAGNLNNIMTAPGPESCLKPKTLAHLQEAERQRLSSTPIGQVADTAAEVADTAEKLDGDKPDDTVPETPSKPQNPESVPVLVTQADEDEDEGPPLFSHEALGAVDFGDDDEPPRSPLVEQEERSHHGSVDYDLDKYDLNDPTLERWPSNDRRSIYDAVRKVETGTNEDQTFFLGSPVSPLVGARRLSMDDEAIDTSAPASPLLAKKLDVPRKKSHSSVVSNKSHTSLAAIVEEGGRQRAAAPEADETATTEDRKTGPPAISVPNPSTQAPEAHRSPASDDDEGVALRSSRKPAPAPATDANANPAPRHAQAPTAR